MITCNVIIKKSAKHGATLPGIADKRSYPGKSRTEVFCSALAPRIEDGKMGSILVSAKLPEPKGPLLSNFVRVAKLKRKRETKMGRAVFLLKSTKNKIKYS